jgi:hypothetical protein
MLPSGRRVSMSGLFQFEHAAVAVPSACIDAFIAEHPPPPAFGAWKARTFLALAALASRPNLTLRVSVTGPLDPAVAGWLTCFCDTVLHAGVCGPPSDATLALLAMPANRADDAAAQDLLAQCAEPAGPQALFIIDTDASHIDDVTFSYAAAAQVLRASDYVQLHDGYFGAWLRARGPDLLLHTRAEARRIPADQQARMLFIIGHARSGTSALFEMLNYHPEVLLLFESNAFLARMRRRFAENFSTRMRAARPSLRKGFFCPAPADQADHPFIVLPALLDHYRLVGEKIALAPRANRFERCSVPACFSYHATHFPFAKYIFLARAPFEATEAIRRILPAADLAEIVRLYAAYMAEMLQYQNIFPVSRVLFMDDFEHLNSAALNELAGFTLLPDGFTLSAEKRTTRQAVPAPHWQGLDYEVRSLHDLYRRTRAMFSTNGYMLRRDLQWPDFEALVAAWKAAAKDAAERAFEES